VVIAPGNWAAEEAAIGLGLGPLRSCPPVEWSNEDDEEEPRGGRGVAKAVEVSMKSDSSKVLSKSSSSLGCARSKRTLEIIIKS